MGSLSTEILSAEEQRIDVGEGSKNEWVLNSPDPPSIWHEFVGGIKEIVIPHRKRRSSSSSSERYSSPFKRVISLLRCAFPILSWGRNYKASDFQKDVMAGLTLASLSIPQSIGYASLAKLDPQYGLYTSAVPPLIYALFGSSRELAIGPVAVVSMLLSSMLQNVEDPNTNPIAYRNLVLTVTFFAGAFQAAFGFFRLGFLVDFLSHAAIVGFMGGAAIVIGLQQLKGLLGITNFTSKTDMVSVLNSVFKSFHQPWSPLNFVLGSLFFIFLLSARFIGRRNKKLFWLPAIAPLISVVLSTLIVFVTKADKRGVKIVKHIKRGLNPSSAHNLQFHGPHVGQAAKAGLISAVVALTEAIAVGRSFASIKGYHLEGNKEMVAMGFMNIVGSLTSCYVATGSFSRTAVNFSSGCETVVSNIVMAVTVMLSLELFTRLLYYSPMAILASIVLSALPGLIDINEAYYIWKVDKLDFLACLGAFLGVLFASVEIGLLAAVSISFGKIVLNSVRPGIEELGRLPRTDVFCNITQYPMAIKTHGLLIIRINTLLCFANANFIRDRDTSRVCGKYFISGLTEHLLCGSDNYLIFRIIRWVSEVDDGIEEKEEGKVQQVILDMSSVMSVDTSGMIALEELQKTLASHGVQLAMADPKWQVIHKLKLREFVERIGGRVFLTVGEAVDACTGSNIN